MKLRYRLPFVFIIVITISMISCSHHNARSNLIKKNQIRAMINQHNQDNLSPYREDIGKLLPELTAEDYEKRGDEYVRQDNMNMSFIEYEKAARLNPESTVLKYKMGTLMLKKGFTEDAESMFQTILTIDPDNAPAYMGLGKSAFIKGDLQGAEINFHEVLIRDDQQWKAYNYLGIICDRQQRFEEAVKHYASAIWLQPANAALYNNMGMSLYLSGQYDKAVRAFEEALGRSDDKKIFNNMALALYKTGEKDRAFNNFNKAGDRASAYNNLGYMHLITGESDKAAKAFSEAIEINPKFYVRANENLEETIAISSEIAEQQ
ncbi:MAG: tetratricopeptide repeat protein [Nitrospiraceae bacterium]|nr:MAG: tetratricopeptide repeat protein [Nitrospiraceae bacterium]